MKKYLAAGGAAVILIVVAIVSYHLGVYTSGTMESGSLRMDAVLTFANEYCATMRDEGTATSVKYVYFPTGRDDSAVYAAPDVPLTSYEIKAVEKMSDALYRLTVYYEYESWPAYNCDAVNYVAEIGGELRWVLNDGYLPSDLATITQ